MTLLRNILFALFYYPGSALISAGSMLLLPFGQRAAIAGGQLWGRYSYWCARHLLGIRTVIEGSIPTEPVLYAFKHEAFYETFEVLRLLRDPAVVFKRELINIPVWGWVAKAHGVIPVDRSAGSAAVRLMLQAAKRVRGEGRSALIFPEGTRVPPGETPPLRPGFAGLYKALGLPVVPVALDSGRVWPRKGLKRSGRVTLRFLPPIPAGLPRSDIEARVHDAINALNR